MGVVIGAALGGILSVVLALLLGFKYLKLGGFCAAYLKKVQVVSKSSCSSSGLGLLSSPRVEHWHNAHISYNSPLMLRC